MPFPAPPFKTVTEDAEAVVNVDPIWKINELNGSLPKSKVRSPVELC